MCPYCTTNICWNMLRKVFYTSKFRFECIYHMLPHVKDKCPYVRLCLGRFMKRRLCISLSRLEMPQIIKIEINLNQSVLRKNIRLCLSEGFCPPSPHRYIFFTVYQFFPRPLYSCVRQVHSFFSFYNYQDYKNLLRKW